MNFRIVSLHYYVINSMKIIIEPFMGQWNSRVTVNTTVVSSILNYLVFYRSGNKKNGQVKFRYSTRNVSKICRIFLMSKFPLPNLIYATILQKTR